MDGERCGQEGYPVTKFLGPGVPRENCVACRVVNGCAERGLFAVNSPKLPFCIVGCRDPTRGWREVAQTQPDQFDRRGGGHDDGELLFEAFASPAPSGLVWTVLDLTC